MRETGKALKLLKYLLILGSVLAALKLIFVDYTLDEEYQIVMAYRHLSGDTMFGTMWEPHQTSAFVCVFLMGLFMKLTGTTTGVVIFLRVCTTVIQVCLAYWVYRTLCKITGREYAFLIAVCYFNIVPKIIQIPEFSNMQLWFFTIMMLSLEKYYLPNQNPEHFMDKIWLVSAGIAMALEVLAYPSDIILFPFIIIFIIVMSRKNVSTQFLANPVQPYSEKIKSNTTSWYDCLIFAFTCFGCAVVWLFNILSEVSLDEFIRNLKYILDFDLTHDISSSQSEKLLIILKDMGIQLLFFGAALCAGSFVWYVVCRVSARTGGNNSQNRYNNEYTDKNNRTTVPFIITIAVPTALAAELIQLVYWLIIQKGYEEPQIHLFTIALIAVCLWRYADGRRRILLPCLVGGALILLSVLYMSDLSFVYAIPHALVGILACLLVIIFALENVMGKRQSRMWILILLFSLSFMSVFGKGFTLRAGHTDTNTIMGIGGVMKKGPAAGIFTNYMQAYINDCDYVDFEQYVEEGSDCLIVTNMVGMGGTTPYIFRNLSVSHFSIVDPTSYDERLLTYWELYPEKTPDVIVVDCWYGDLKESPDNWIMQYIENDYGYTRVEEGNYVRFYFK